MSGTRIELRAYAKINLFLAVHGPRPDGFHDVTTILHNVDVADHIGLEVGEGDGIGLRVTGPRATSVSEGPDNLMQRAARSLGVESVSMTLEKRIPVAGGLGGGSADAAAVLAGLASATAAPGTTQAVAASLGSDVPFFLTGGTALASGRGELTEAVPAESFWFVIGVFDRGLATADVYRAWHAAGRDAPTPESVLVALRQGDAPALGAALHNDLEAPAISLRPELGAATAALLDAGALGASVSGSGPSVFAVVESREHGHEVATRAAGAFDEVLVVRSAPAGVEVVG